MNELLAAALILSWGSFALGAIAGAITRHRNERPQNAAAMHRTRV